MKFAFDYALALLDDNKLCLYDISKMERQIKEKAKNGGESVDFFVENAIAFSIELYKFETAFKNAFTKKLEESGLMHLMYFILGAWDKHVTETGEYMLLSAWTMNSLKEIQTALYNGKLEFANEATEIRVCEEVSNEEITELCPFCDFEITVNWDPETQGYEIFCPNCGRKILLCDACMHAEDGGVVICDWTEKGGCFRNNPHKKGGKQK